MYIQFLRFLLPLVLTVVAQEVGGQVLNGGMARVPQATETLASYGLAWGLVNFTISPLLQITQLGLVLVDSQHALRKVRTFALICSSALAGILATLALTPLGVWVVEDLHGVDRALGTVAREALFWLIPIPLLRGLIRFYTGLLMRIRRTDVVSYAILSGIGASILAVFALLPARFVQERPIRLPLLVTYAGALAELAVVLWGRRQYARHRFTGAGERLTLAYVFRFFWPLALIMAIQGLSRPLINLFVSRGEDGAEALAVLTVVYTLGHLPYGWLNEIRNLPPAFKDKAGSLPYIRRFALGCGLFSFSVMIALFWTPLRGYILETLIGIDAALVAHSGAPLILFSFFPLTVMTRAYLHGIGLLEHRTKVMAPSGPSRIGAILVTLTILSTTQLHGATRGVAALLSGFVVETLAVGWGVLGRGHRNGQSHAVRPEPTPDEESSAS